MSSSEDTTIEGRISLLDQLLHSSLTCDDDGIDICLVAREGLLDALLALYEECSHYKLMSNKLVAAFVKKYSHTVAEIRRLRIKPSDFEVKDVIGRGHFGEVQVVRDRHTETVYAMKTLRKQETLAQSEISFYKEERDIMAHARSPWLTKLQYAFQDAHTLYLVMEFHAGGDLLSLLSRHDDIFEEKMAKFYLAEIVLATHDLHLMGYVHRDLKPENVLLDCTGHVKLADFGSAAQLSSDGLVSSKMPVGTPDYVSPELLNAMNSDRVNNYGTEVDWWSLGVCMYEMLYGKTPFTDEAGSMVATYSNIMNFKACLKFPSSAAISSDAKGLMNNLLTEKEKRLDYQGIIDHAFFTSLDWNNMRGETPPFVPQLQSLDDTSNFEEFEKIKHPHTFEDPKNENDFSGKDLPFVGFTYIKKQKVNDKKLSPNLDVGSEHVFDIDTAINTKCRRSSTSVDVTLTLKMTEMKRLREKCNLLEESECNLKSTVEQLKLTCGDKDEMISKLELENDTYTRDLENYVAKTNRLSKQLEVMVEERVSMEMKAERVMVEINDMSSEAKHIEQELHQLQLEELQDVIAQLEEEKSVMVRKVSQRDRQLLTYKEQLETSQKHAAQLQFRIDKERRKSRDDQKRDLVLLENREDIWRTQVEDKNAEILDLNKRVVELEDMIDAFETQEREYMTREQELRGQLKHRETDTGDNFDIRVHVHRSPTSPKKDRKMSEKFKELEDKLETHDAEKQKWEKKEEEMKDQMEKLKCEVESRLQRDRVASEVKESLASQVHMYQQEIQEQRNRIKELQESVKLCLSESDDDKTRKQNRLEKKIKDLEEQVDSFRDDKRRLLADVSKHQLESNNRQYKVTELERTNSRLSCKIERLERQLNEAKEKEIDLRLRRSQTSDIRIKLAEERVADIEQEKVKLEAVISSLTKEMDEMKSKQNENDDKVHTATSKLITENLDLKTKMDEVNRTVEKFDKQVTKCERNISSLEDDISSKNQELQTLRSIKDEKSNTERKLKNLECVLKEKEEKLKVMSQKEKELTKMEREKENLETKIKSLEKDIEDLKTKEKSAERRGSKFEDVEDLRQEKRYLESRVTTLQRQLDNADKKVNEAEKKLADKAVTGDKLKMLEREIDTLKHEKASLQDEVRDMKVQTDRKLKQQADNGRDVQVAEEKLDQEREKHDSLLAELRRELNMSNLALSEARSLVSANQRQAKQTQASLEEDIRELQQRVFKIEKEKGLNEDKWISEHSHKLNATAEMENDLKTMKSQNESLIRKQKETEDKLSAVQREKTASLMEKTMLKDSLAQRENQCQLETQKVDKLRAICTELENQIKDLEALHVDHESQEAEWKEARQSYERVMEERETELEGTTHRLNALKQARQSSHDIAHTVKQQLQSAKDKHKADLDMLKKQANETRRDVQRSQIQMADLESQNSKLQMIVEQQKTIMDNDIAEKRRLKEEISSILTESQEVKTKNIKLRQNLEEAVDKLELIFGEKIDLENFTEALQGLHFLEKYRFESTIDQQMKLIDYLQALWQDNVNKKKKGGKFFGKGKDGSTPQMPILGDLQTALDAECKRSRQLQQQLDRLRGENFTQANELLKLKGTLRERSALNTGNITAAVQVLIQSPSSRPNPGNALLTPSTKRSTRMLAEPVPTPQRMHHKIPHRFVNGLNTRATKCAVCLGSVHFVKQAAKCQECSMVCHPKCVVSIPATCGLPSEYVRHFSTMMDTNSQLPSNSSLAQPEGEVIKMKGWMKIPKIGKQAGWESRWCVMEGNILLLFNNDCDANPVDTFDLNPPETDVTVHSAVSTAELPSTANTDLPYVLRLEHESLTTCWPGRILYLMAHDFTEKQQWVACLEAAIKHLQKVDKTRRCKIKVSSLLELTGDKRLELNCSLLLSKQLTLLGADEGLYAVNVYREPAVLTKLNQFDSIHQLKFIPQLSLIVLVAGKKREVLTIDKKLIQLRLGQSNGEETQPVPHNVVKEIVGCTVLDVNVFGDAVYMCVGMTEKVVLMKYNLDLRLFCVRKEISICEPCSCVCMADNFAIVGTDRFYQINLEHPSLTEFVDKKDNSLAFAAFGAATHHSYPLAVVQVSPEGLPFEFLICFHEFGVYVDSKGRRTRPADMKWSCLPLSFAYREPFLYVTYFNSVQAITVPAYKEEIRGKQTSIDLTCPRFLGAALEPGTVYVGSSSGVTTELLNLCGNDGTIIEPMGKENRKGVRSGQSTCSNSSSKSGSERYVSPKKQSSYTSSKYQTSRKGRRLSLTSINSNSSVSSSSTVSSYGDRQSIQSDI